MILLTYNPLFARIGLVILGLLLVVVYLAYHSHRVRKARSAVAPAASPDAPPMFAHSLHAGHSVTVDIFRALLILLAIGIASSLILISLSDATLDRIAQTLRLRSGQTQAAEQISLLYLGDETKGKEFHIRGVIRNISTQPIDKLDATVRLYAPDGNLLETAVVRMDSEVIAPDATSQFHLSYPDFNGQFGSYTVDFKLRDGAAMPYKDMRHGA
jgi:hypothetical protein